MSAVTRDLKAADFEKRLVTKTLDGLSIKPFYRRQDTAPARINAPLSRTTLREEIRESDLLEANEHIVRCLNRGAEEVTVHVYPIGPKIRSQRDVRALLKGVWMEAVPIHWLTGPLAIPVLAMILNEAQARDIKASELAGSVDFDPILDRCAGWTVAPLDSWKEEFRRAIDMLMSRMPKYNLLTIRGSLIEKAGASLGQELAFTISLFAEYLIEAAGQYDAGNLGHGRTRQEFLGEIVRRTELRFGVGTNYFLEIAKLRAARILVENLAKTFEVQDVPTIHVVTTSSNKTLYDPYNNLLRATIESMAGLVGVADSLSIAAYDQGYHAPDEFSEHLARNTHTLLKDEAHLDAIVDPLGGSYAVEAVTQGLSEVAWNLFSRIEEKGGFVEAWKDGFIGSELTRVRNERQRQVSKRRRKIVGTTVYASAAERRIQDVRPQAPLQQIREDLDWDIEDLLAYFTAGGRIGSLFTSIKVKSTPLDPFRPSWPFENLRLRVERFVAIGGARPKVLLAMWGDKKMRQARRSFCQSFFAAGGYEVQELTVESPKDLASIAEREKADLVVLCSSDAEVSAMADEALSSKGRTPVVVAGHPEGAVDQLKALGVYDFVHIGCDLLESLTRFHQLFGIPEIPLNEPLNPEEK
jgi:methylmalonyl-CoA mutase